MTASLPQGFTAPQPRAAPNAWRPTTERERKWLLAPAVEVRNRALAWSLIPGLGHLRYGRVVPGLAFLALGGAAFALVALSGGGALWSGLVVGAVFGAQTDLARVIAGRSGTEFQERTLAWLSARRSGSRDCPRCGMRAASPTGFCAPCHAELAPYAQAYLTPGLVAVDGLSFATDASLGAYLVEDLLVHTCLGREVRRGHATLRQLHAGMVARTTELGGQVLAAYAEPGDPNVAWLVVRASYRLVNGTFVCEDEVRRARYDGGRAVEIWETLVGVYFPEGHPADLAGRTREAVPDEVLAAVRAA